MVIVYFGNGKGKTTAAVGLAVRAAGSGFRVLFLQFVKGEWPSGETKILKTLPKVEVKILGRGFVGILGDRKDPAEHRAAAFQALAAAREALASQNYDLVILDEAISAVESKLLREEDLLALIAKKPQALHLCLTGHKRFPKLVAAADLVTEMKMIKHPYYKGILAQRGLDY